MNDPAALPRPLLAFGFAFALVVMLGGVLAWIGFHFKLDRPETMLPTIVIVGVFALLMSLAAVAIALSILGLSDKAQPLALPEGSIRAVIALTLVVLFAIIAIFLYNSLANSGSVQSVEHLTQDQRESFSKSTSTTILLTQPEEAKDKDGKQLFRILYEDHGNQAAQDVAKQLLVLLGTLVTAVSSFYFGANSVANAVATASKAAPPPTAASRPKLSETDPRSLTRGGANQNLRVIGENLSGIRSVKLVRGGEEIVATDVVPGDSHVTCKVLVTNTHTAGKWDVVVADASAQAKLTAYLDLV